MDRAYAIKLLGSKELFERIKSFNLDRIKAANRSESSAAAVEGEDDLVELLRQQYPKLRLFKLKATEQEERPALKYFEDKISRLLLLSRVELTQLCRYLGAARLHPYLRTTLVRSELEEIKRTIGTEIYTFVLSFAAFALPQSLVIKEGSLTRLKEAAALGAALLIPLAEQIEDAELKTLLTDKLTELLFKEERAVLSESDSVRLQALVEVILQTQLEVSLG